MKAFNMCVQSQVQILGVQSQYGKGKIQHHPDTDFKFSPGVISVGQEAQSKCRTLGFKSCFDFKVLTTLWKLIAREKAPLCLFVVQ